MPVYYLAVDIGASSGRHILGSIEDGRIVLEEVYRFQNGMIKKRDISAGTTGSCLNILRVVLKNAKI